MSELQVLVDRYVRWLKDKTIIRQINDWAEITTPYLDRHNDYIQIYAKQRNGGFVLTDDGITLEDLEQCGCALDTPKRRQILNTTLNGFGIKEAAGALETQATSENFSIRKHNLIQAILAVNDMFYLASPTVMSLFWEEVAAWLDKADIRYTPRVKFTGKSGYDHMFDFVIPKSRQEPERILRTINNPNKDNAMSVAFGWIDTREARPSDSRAFALLNDEERAITNTVMDALRNYDIEPVPWSQRERVQHKLAA